MVLYDTLFKVLKYALDKVYKKEIYRHLFRHLIKSWKILICLKVPKIGMVRIKRLELPCLSAPDPKSFFNNFSYFLKLFQFLSKYLFLGIYRLLLFVNQYYIVSLFFNFCSKNCSKKRKYPI